AAYLAVGRIFKSYNALRKSIIKILEKLIMDESERIRQSVIYSCGEIAINDFSIVEHIIEAGLRDKHHSVRNAVIGSLKKSGQKDHIPVIDFCKKHILSSGAEIRKQACHGLELRGRTHPQDIIFVLKLLQYEKVKRVRDMLIHVLGQISYKKDCFGYVINQLKTWENEEIYLLACKEIIKVHGKYEKFSAFTQNEIIEYFIKEGYNP
ncbi:MAG: HEAT repeat domain-containing protein, partial [Christensenellales bacterium]